jgi:hypothetical protein
LGSFLQLVAALKLKSPKSHGERALSLEEIQEAMKPLDHLTRKYLAKTQTFLNLKTASFSKNK